MGCGNCKKECETKCFENNYIVKWKLRNENGREWIETMYGMALSDFEVAYGNITDEILWIQMRLKNQAII